MNTERIRYLNDQFRRTFTGGRVVVSAGVAALPNNVKANALAKVREFDGFNSDNDPHGEHDFAGFELNGEKFFWKIDYYDECLDGGSEDPADPQSTIRVLTIILEHEY
jgi:uncharacterized protein DUF3768